MNFKGTVLEKYSIKPVGDQYSHETLYIDSLSKYIEVISSLNDIKDNKFPKENLYFRGHSDIKWILSPLIKRLNLEKHEKYIINYFRIDRPEDYNNSMSYLDILGKMQHYGYPTRLIDFTENPLIALYFACKEDVNKDKDARVIINRRWLDLHYDPPFIEALFQMIDKYSHAFYERPIKEFDSFVDSIIDLPHLKGDKGIYKYLDIMYNFGKFGLPTMPIRITERQKKQKSTFLIFPDDIINPMNGEIIDIESNIMKPAWDHTMAENQFTNSIRIPQPLNYFFNSIIIPSHAKEMIIRDLESIGIDEASLFPELEYSSKTLIEKLIKIKE